MTKNENVRTRQSARPAAPGRGAHQILRHRQARLRIEPRPLTGPGRFAHLRRTYD